MSLSLNKKAIPYFFVVCSWETLLFQFFGGEMTMNCLFIFYNIHVIKYYARHNGRGALQKELKVQLLKFRVFKPFK